MNLRPYQKETIDALREAFKKHKKLILCLPTGGGKTIVFSKIAFESSAKGTRVLILTDRIELFNQTAKSINKLDVMICKIDSKNKTIPYTEANLFVGMVETVKRRLEVLKSLKPQLIIIDEAHKSAFFKVMDAFPESYVIGATATPVNKKLHLYYDEIVNLIDIPDLIEQGFLSPCKAYQMQDNFDDVKIDSTGEFETNSLYNHFNKSKLYEGVIQEYIDKCKGKKAIVFNVNIKHSRQMTAAFNAAGIKSFSVTSDTPDHERKSILEAFSRGEFPVLNNCGILTTGYDEPSIEVVIMNRATTSLPLWLQCAGRGSRIYPNKNYFTLLDFGMNHNRHGLWAQPREWSLDPPKKKKKKDGVAPVKSCPKCAAMIAAQTQKCSYCGHEMPRQTQIVQGGKMVEVKSKIPDNIKGKRVNDLSIQELIDLEKTKLYKPTFIWKVVRSRGESAIKHYADIKGYKSGWVDMQVKDIANSHYNNFIIKEVSVKA